MKIVVSYSKSVLNVQEQVTRVFKVAPFNVPSGITLAAFTAAGDLMVGLGSESFGILSQPGADGQVLTSNTALSKKMEWAAPSGGGGGGTLTNKRGTSVSAGNVLILENAYDASFNTTVVDSDLRVIGVANETIANNSDGSVLSFGKGTILVQGNVSRGEWLVASTTDGRARAAGYAKPRGAIGIALDAYSGGGAGSVNAWIMVATELGASSGRGYILGGNTGASSTVSQRVTFASETAAGVSSAALGTAKYCANGMNNLTKAYAVGGWTSAYTTGVEAMTLATETTAVVSGAALPVAKGSQSNGVMNGTTAGYDLGGYTTGATNLGHKLVFATEVSSAVAGTNLSSSRYGSAGVGGSTEAWVCGGYTSGGANVATGDKLTLGTETTAASSGSDLSLARRDVHGANCVTHGYMAGGITSGVVTTTDKLTYSSGTTAVSSSAALSAAGCNANGMGVQAKAIYAGRNNGSGAVSTADRITASTDTLSNVPGCAIPTALSYGATSTFTV